MLMFSCPPLFHPFSSSTDPSYVRKGLDFAGEKFLNSFQLNVSKIQLYMMQVHALYVDRFWLMS